MDKARFQQLIGNLWQARFKREWTADAAAQLVEQYFRLFVEIPGHIVETHFALAIGSSNRVSLQGILEGCKEAANRGRMVEPTTTAPFSQHRAGEFFRIGRTAPKVAFSDEWIDYHATEWKKMGIGETLIFKRKSEAKRQQQDWLAAKMLEIKSDGSIGWGPEHRGGGLAMQATPAPIAEPVTVKVEDESEIPF